MKLYYMHGRELRVIDKIVDAKYGQTYYHITHEIEDYRGMRVNVKSKVFTRFIVLLEEF